MSDRHDPRELKASIRELATALEESLTVHLGPEELRDFAAGALPEPERERMREHLALCRTCARKALDLMESPQLPDRELEEQWKRFRAAAMPAPSRWKRAVLALAAVLLLGVVGVVWNAQSRRFEVDLAVTRGPAEQVQLPARTGRVRFNLDLGELEESAYDVEIVAADGHEVLSERGVPQRGGVIAVEVPARRLPRGAYRIRVSGPQRLAAEYRVQIEPTSD